jgi:hypothetical protein
VLAWVSFGVSQATGKAEREIALAMIDWRGCDDGYGVSQRCRKRIEEVFGWIKSSAGLAKIKLRGRARGRRLHAGTCSLQPDPPAQTAGGADMSVQGKWRGAPALSRD